MEADGDVVIFLGISVVMAFYYCFRFLRHCRLIEDTPTSRVRSAHQGYVELEGLGHPVQDEAYLISPLSKTGCIWWFYEIEKKVRRNKSTSWDTIDKKTSDSAFLLEDATGRCLINPLGAEVVTTHKHQWYGSTAWPGSGPPAKPSFFQVGSYRYTERLIKPGEAVYALGLFKTLGTTMDADEENAALGAMLAEWKQDATRMQVFDVNKDGAIDVKEWEAARRVALRQLRRERQVQASEGLHTMSKPETKSQPYLISTVLQHDLCRRWRRYSGLCFAWFLIGGSLFVWQLIEYGLL
jgi:hypothetical protein